MGQSWINYIPGQIVWTRNTAIVEDRVILDPRWYREPSVGFEPPKPERDEIAEMFS